MFKNIYPREKYLERIRPFYDSDIIKVITGIRRCGKSCIMKAIMNELCSKDVSESQIIYIPLDRRGYKTIKTPEQLEEKIESMLGNEEKYYLYGGFPKTLEFDDVQARQTYTRGSISEIFEKDVKKRKRISNVPVYERVQSFLLNNYSAPFSLNSLLECLKKEGYKTKAITVRGYIEELKKAKIVYECNRFDLKSKKSLKRDQKYYLSDLAIYFAMNTDNRLSFGPSLENIVFLFLQAMITRLTLEK